MGKYTFKPYSDSFPLLFSKEKERIAPHLPSSACIEHVGSTAVPSLGGKGIIDIAIAVDKAMMEEAKNRLQELEYEFRPSFSTADRFYFIIYLPDPEEGNRRYHVHLTYPQSKEWKELTGFRDFLLSNPDALQEYAELKKKAAIEAGQDGEKYRKAKEPMFQKFNASQSILNRLYNYIERARNLFEWNRQNLISESTLKKEEIVRFFAAEFLVEANGQSYEANYDNYYDFLNKFKENIKSIDYILKEFIESNNAVIIPLSAFIVRTNGQEERFEAILILKFDAHGKIVLWHEVYVGVDLK
jgi:GrpB-like predicted nucleotidyltransferase (UPF0157 family)